MCDFNEIINIFQGWGNLDWSSLSFDVTSMVTNGILDIPKVIADWNQIQCEGTCTCPDEDGNIPVVTRCDSYVNGYAQGKLLGNEFARFFKNFTKANV